ncbi:MAG: phage major capsid protein, partial [Oscillospiraceae bacterium]|nr:phage major capsid protein [Oscillospiraceae bacterium]
YDTVKLEKGMYHLANRSFTQALEAADPSAQYAGTELSELDAFERQLKRFDIHVSGENCDPVEKFFTTTESAVLFPEFVRRAIKRGMEESILPELTAASSSVRASSCKGFSIDETDGAYSATTAEGVSLKRP